MGRIAILAIGLAISGCGLGPRASGSWARSDKTDAFAACHSVLGLNQAECLCVVKKLEKVSPEKLFDSVLADAVQACLPPEPEPEPFLDYA